MILYPRFSDCQKYTFDNYWKILFQSCSINRFPKNMKYDSQQNVFYIKTQSKTEKIDLPSDDEELYYLMMDIFRNKLYLCSDYDLKIQRKEIEEFKDEITRDLNKDKKDSKLKSIKVSLLIEYVLVLQDKYELTPKESKELISTIQRGLALKKLSRDDITYHEGTIKSIRGLEFDEKHRKFYITNKPKNVTKSEKPQVNQKFNTKVKSFVRQHSNRKKLITVL